MIITCCVYLFVNRMDIHHYMSVLGMVIQQ